MEPNDSHDDTAFAPAPRAGRELVAWQHNAVLSDATAVALLEAMPGPAMVLNRQRQVIGSNSQLHVMFSTAECENLIGRRPGEILGCVRATERATGCGTTPACAQCGAVQAILESLATRGRSVKECRIRTSFRTHTGARDFRVFATWAEIGGEEVVIFALMDITSEVRKRELERTLFRDVREEFSQVLDQPVGAENSAAANQEEAFRRRFGDLSARVLEQIEAHRQLMAAENGELHVVTEEVNLRELLDTHADACRASWAGRGREVWVETRGAATARTDRVQLGRVVDGLLRNALEATPEGGRVKVSATHDGDLVTISVHNAGMIPLEVQHQIFQRSFSTKNGEGRGIGTYSVKLLVERYLDGSAEFTSDAGHGTVFTVTVPDRPAERAAA